MALSTALAFAGLYHPKPAACSFGNDGTSGSSFQFSKRIALQKATKRLFVTKSVTEPSGIFGFDASTVCPTGGSGGYPPLSGFEPLAVPELNINETDIAVDNTALPSAGNIYLSGRNRLLGYDAAGNILSGFPKLSAGPEDLWTAVAVDPGGNLWAAWRNAPTEETLIRKFSPAGVELDKIDLTQSVALDRKFIASLDFNSLGDLYVSSRNGVWKLPGPTYESALEVDRELAVIAVDRATDDLYVARENQIDRYGSGGALLEQFPAVPPSDNFTGIAVDEASNAVYAHTDAGKVEVFEPFVLPDLTITPPSDLAETTVSLNGTVSPDGLALTGCKFEWVSEEAFEATGFADLSSGGEHECEPPFGSISSSGKTSISAAIASLGPGKTYRYRVSASNANGANTNKGVVPSLTLTQPEVETVGSPIRTAATARLDSRVNPRGIATQYRFEYLTEAAYEANLAASQPPFEGAESTPSQPAGEGALAVLVSQDIEGLTPASAYRYRVVADNGAFGGPTFGEARTVETRASDQPFSHGDYPGPPGSDRAWEQVNLPDTAGNPVNGMVGLAADGDSVLYQVAGGTSESENGSLADPHFARRPTGAHPTKGWRNELIFPSRGQATFNTWLPPGADNELSTALAVNRDFEDGAAAAVWGIPITGGVPIKLYEAKRGEYVEPYLLADDGSHALLGLQGEHVDPAKPSPDGEPQLYDVTSGTPRMASLLPGEVVPSCGSGSGQGLFDLPLTVRRSTHWVSADGSRLFFPNSCETGSPHLYMRDFEAGETTQIDALPSGLPLSGPDCSGVLIRTTPASAYFWTQSRLVEEDAVIAGSCDDAPDELTPGGDVYRYDLEGGGFECLTCALTSGKVANVIRGGREGVGIAVAPEGPRIYFATRSRLLSGAAEAGTPAIYRLDTETHELAYVGPLNPGERVGERPVEGTAITPDGRFLAFRSAAAGLDPLTGSDNGGTLQHYVYDDEERSLSCASCPPDGGVPRAAAAEGIVGEAEGGPNMTSLTSREGRADFAFATPTPLVGADQNTAPAGQNARAGIDVYEWRDGRVLLVSDGLTNWPTSGANVQTPRVASISPAGRDLFFIQASQLTPDALDGNPRLYDARIGGGIDFPEAQKPCPLEVCQGTPKGTPEEAAPGSSSFQGPGNPKSKPKPRCPKGKVRRSVKGKTRCVPKKQKAKKQSKRRARR